MKKLSLEMLHLSSKDVLNRSHLAKILGGSISDGKCTIRCNPEQPNGTSVQDCTTNTMNFYCPREEYPDARCNCTAASIE